MRYFGGKFRLFRHLWPEIGESLAKIKNHSQLPNIFMYYHYLINFHIIWRSTYSIIVTGKGLLNNLLILEADTAWNRGIPRRRFARVKKNVIKSTCFNLKNIQVQVFCSNFSRFLMFCNEDHLKLVPKSTQPGIFFK